MEPSSDKPLLDDICIVQGLISLGSSVFFTGSQNPTTRWELHFQLGCYLCARHRADLMSFIHRITVMEELPISPLHLISSLKKSEVR